MPTRRQLLRAGAAAGIGAALRACLPRNRKADAAKPVIVLGAGLAGLSAAYELMLSGYDVRVVEARQRPGGRVETLRKPFEQGLHAEAGATFIPSIHPLPAHYIRLFGLELDPLTPPQQANLRTCLHLRGRRICDRREPLPFELTPDERRLKPMELFDKLVTANAASIGDPDQLPLAEAFLAADRESVVEYLRRVGASPGAIELLTRIELWPWGDIDNVSALLILRDALHFKKGQNEMSLLRGGTERLPLAFASRLGDRIAYETVVERLEHDEKGVRVGIRRRGQLSTIEGARAICTLPFSVLSRVEFSPGLSAEKRRAIEELPYVSVTRVYLETRERFWEREGLNRVFTDLPITLVEPMTPNQPGTHGILEAHLAGANARQLMALGREARIHEVRDQVSQVFPNLPGQFIRGTSKCWDEDPWARGAYTCFKPGQMASLLPHMGTAEGRIHFAGEHTSAYQGWMQGALASGQRVAEEIRALPRG